MSKRLEITKEFVNLLAKSSAKRRKVLLRNASNTQLKGLFEVCLNIIRGNLPLDAVQFRRMKRHRKTLETLVNRRIPIYKKREVINQKGGFVASLAKYALPLLTHVIATQIGKIGRRRKKK